MPKPTIIVIGAGVVGLSTAITLQQHYPTHNILIVAAEGPLDQTPSADYASAWAGAHYRPIPGETMQLCDEAEMAFVTAKTMLKIAREDMKAGVGVVKGVEYLEVLSEEVKSLKTGDVYAWREDGFRVLGREELPIGVEWGCEYETYCVNVPLYLRWLMRRFQDGGGKAVMQRLENVKGVFLWARAAGVENVRCVVNCSGRNFDDDVKVKIIRGQTVLVKQEFDKTVTRQCRDGSWAFLIPRPGGGGTIVGGTKEVGDVEIGAREESRESLLRAAVQHFPDFVKNVDDFIVVKDKVGRRPWREGGLRIEAEQLNGQDLVVHGYGAGGRGYELSWGAAERIADVVGRNLEAKASL